MALTYGFFDSEDGDRAYEAADFNRIFDGIITDGVFESVGDALAVTSAENGMLAIVGSGRAWFNNTWTYNDTTYPVVIPTAETLLYRVDAIVLEVDKTNDIRANSIKVITGEPAYSDPPKPTLIHEGGVDQYALAYVSVAPGATELDSGDIENVIGTEETPYVTGLVDQLDVENIVLQWQTDFDTYFANWQSDKQDEFNSFMETIVNELSTSEIGAIQASILKKEDAPKILTKTLAAGATSLSFTDTSITDDSLIDVYSSPFGVTMLTANQSGTTVYLTFKPFSEDASIRILVRNE